MAELSYDDVRRASQDAIRDLQGLIHQIHSHTNDIHRTTQQINGTPNQLNELGNRLNNLQQQMVTLNSQLRNVTYSAQLLQTMQQHLVDLHRRMTASEQFIQFCYKYFDALQKAEAEKEPY